MTTITTAVPGVKFSTSGLEVPDEADVLAGRLTDLSTELGSDMSRELRTPQGQIAVSDTAIIAEKNDQLLAIANSVNPDFASGRWQDAIGRIYFLDRIPALGTTVTATCRGLVGTVIPAGSLARDTAGYVYASQAGATIPASGEVDIVFQNQTTGPVACPVGALNSIFRAVNGWSEVVNATAGVPGNDLESRASFEYRRRQSVAKNARNTRNAIRSAVLEVPGVVDAYVTSNDTGAQRAEGASKYQLKPHSLYVGVYGGQSAEIADAVWRAAPPGVDMNGDSAFTIADSENYQPPCPEYRITWQTAKAVRVRINVQLRESDLLPNTMTDLVRERVLGAFNGTDGGTRARIGASLFSGRYYAGIYNIDQSNVDILSVALSRDGAAFSHSLTFGIDEIPTLSADDIIVTLV
ncbi:bacteriophage protein [Pluralibacter gergoviae]|uniref:baseplate J/gp47 family protein n=1 Tax=Pluralibacter gergoviae TaxID=61647 RepID=UPI0006517442|nr:baseplate J/gp47 family protein [Pluralibacter gergoviae]KMK23088.1 bacteriophage protein [Pluralibacter gergoviae]